MSRRAVPIAALVAASLLAAACGGDEPDTTLRVPEVAVTELAGLVVSPVADTRDRIDRAGEDLLVDDAVLLALTADDQTVGSVQLSVWDQEVDDPADSYETVLAAFHTGRQSLRSIGSTEVISSLQEAPADDPRPDVDRFSFTTDHGFVLVSLRSDLDDEAILGELVVLSDRLEPVTSDNDAT
jgi:hypothetical protein